MEAVQVVTMHEDLQKEDGLDKEHAAGEAVALMSHVTIRPK